MRVAVDALFRIRNAYVGQSFNAPLADFFALNLWIMRAQSFGHLPPNRKDGIERARRFLKDHGDIASAHFA